MLADGPRRLVRESVDRAVASVDRGLDRAAIEEIYLATLGFSGWQLGNSSAVAAEESGRAGVPTVRVENACASGGFALRLAVDAVSSGRRNLVLVIGLEKMTDVSNARRRYWLGVSGDTEWERSAGLTFAGVYGLMASRYESDYGPVRDALTAVAIKNHAQAALNPNAHFQKPVTREQVNSSPLVAAPLSLYDCCPVSDGAAAVLVARPEVARRWTDTPVYVVGSGAGSDWLAVQDREHLTRLAATRQAADEAFRNAPFDRKRLDFAEVHDCFTIAELLALEDLGLAPRGGAGRLTLAGATRLGGPLPINPDGGLKGKGHPIGATGVSQVHEVYLQLRGQAGARQVEGARRALTHNVGGSGATAAVHLFAAG